MEDKQWIGLEPEFCDKCGEELTEVFVDGFMVVKAGSVEGLWQWKQLCLYCHSKFGLGLGCSKGFLYERGSDGKFYDVTDEYLEQQQELKERGSQDKDILETENRIQAIEGRWK